MSVLKYRNPSYVEGGSQPKWLTVGSSSGDSNGGGSDGGNGGGDTPIVPEGNFIAIKLTSDVIDNYSGLNGVKVNITNTYTGETITRTWNGSDIIINNITTGVTYSITPLYVNGYETPETVSFVSLVGENAVTFFYSCESYLSVELKGEATGTDYLLSGSRIKVYEKYTNKLVADESWSGSPIKVRL